MRWELWRGGAHSTYNSRWQPNTGGKSRQEPEAASHLQSKAERNERMLVPAQPAFSTLTVQGPKSGHGRAHLWAGSSYTKAKDILHVSTGQRGLDNTSLGPSLQVMVGCVSLTHLPPQWVMVLADKTEGMSLILESQRWKERTQSHKVL